MEPIISDLKDVTQDMIDAIEEWMLDVREYRMIADSACPLAKESCEGTDCSMLFENIRPCCHGCPCHLYGQKETMLAFTIICDVWPAYKED